MPGAGDAMAAVADAAPDAGGPWLWRCAEGSTEVNEYEPGTYLDLTKTADMQTGAGSSSSIGCFKQAEDGLSSWGGVWLQSWRDPEAPGSGAFTPPVSRSCWRAPTTTSSTSP